MQYVRQFWKKKMYFVFFDQEKTFDRVLREMVWCILIMLVDEKLVEVIMKLYGDLRTSTGVNGKESEESAVTVGAHKGPFYNSTRSIIKKL